MITVYCDDSGTHRESTIVVAACFLSDLTQWEHFVLDWEAANVAEHFGVFHMADFVGRYKQFASKEWRDEEKRDRTIKRLINIINTRKRHGFFACVEKSAYDAEVPDDIRKKFRLGKNHYTFAVRMCMGRIMEWRVRHHYQGPIQYVFDRMTKGSGDISAAFELALEEGKDTAMKEHGIFKDGWSFQDKAEVLPLQSADILAWESLHHMQNVVLPEIPKTPRQSYRELARIAVNKGLHDRESLRNLVAHIREKQKAASN